MSFPSLALLLAAVLQPPQSARPPEAPAGADSAGRDVVRTIEVERLPVYQGRLDTLPVYKRLMNRLHVTTRDRVVRREVLLRVGEPYDSARAAETARNLRNLRIFQAAHVDSVQRAFAVPVPGDGVRPDTALVARVVTEDAFTMKPYISFRSSGGQATYGIGMYESNLFGNLINVGAKFKHDPDRNSFDMSARAPRIIDDRVGLYTTYSLLSDGKQATAGVELPYLSLSARTSLTVTGELFDGRVLRFVEGDTTPADSVHRNFGIVRLLAGQAVRAGPAGYLRAELRAQIRREDFGPEPAPDSLPRTITGAAVLRVEARRAGFVVVQNYRNIGPDEDIDVSTSVRVGLAVAPEAWGYARNGLGPEIDAQTGLAFRGGFVTGRLQYSGLYGSEGADSSTMFVSATGAVQPLRHHSAILFVGGGRQLNPYPGAEFDLGLTRGPRAFPAHAFTGDRMFFLSGEYRAVVIPNLKDLVGVGVAAFGDYGGAWYAGATRRTGTDFGVGVRVGSSRFPSANGAARFDVAYRLKNDRERAGWVIALGSGFVFDRTR
jgi:hypothetical protein